MRRGGHGTWQIRTLAVMIGHGAKHPVVTRLAVDDFGVQDLAPLDAVPISRASLQSKTIEQVWWASRTSRAGPTAQPARWIRTALATCGGLGSGAADY